LNQSSVAVVEAGKDITAEVKRAINLVGGLRLKGDERVVIKPNICNSKNAFNMVLTDFRIIEAIIGIVKTRTDDIIVVESDNVSGSAEKRMSESGLLQMLEELDVGFLNISKDEAYTHQIAGITIRIPKSVIDAEFFINLPKVKTEGHTLVTLSIKNLFGILQRAKKNKIHRHLNQILPYLAKMVHHDLIIADGITAMEGNGPVIGTPKDLGIIVAGMNPVAVDAMCTTIMGFKPAEVEHLARAHRMGVGEIELENLNIFGDEWKKLTKIFERPYTLKATLKSIRSIRKIYL
jgi:uncharacterized protein (DUF362 family)